MNFKESIEPSNQAGIKSNGFIYFYLHGVKNAFVNALRNAFSDENVPEEYRYNTNSEKSQIAIYKNFPNRNQKFPLIIVETESGKGDFTFLSDEILCENDEADDNGYHYGGVMKLDVSISIYTQSIKDIERLTDLVYLFLRFVFRNKFQENNIAYNKISIKGESVEDAEFGRLYKNVITTTVTCDFTSFIPRSVVEKIEKINISFNINEI